MNAISSIAIAGEETNVPTRIGRSSGHIFRSRLLDKLAEIETWAVGRLRAAGTGKKALPTLGLKLGAVRKLTESHPQLFRKALTAAQLLDDLRPFQELRSSLAHSVLTDGRAEDGTNMCAFDQADSDGSMPWRDRIVIREDEFGQVISRVSDIANQLQQQIPSGN